MSDEKPVLSIIIISYNTQDVTEACINSIYNSSMKQPFEIIMLDNNSSDGSLKMLQAFQKKHSNFNLIENKTNIGFGKANNLGVKKAQGKYILFLNSDTIILDNAIAKLLDFYIKNENKLHFLGAKLLNKDKSPQASAGKFFTPAMTFAFLFLMGDRWGFTRSSPDKIVKTDWISGACILTKKEILNKVGEFDENIFMYMDEVDLLYRASKLGFSTYFYSPAHIIHLGSASSAKRKYPILQVYKGLLYFYHKHYTPFSIYLLKSMLKLKSLVALTIGKATGNQYLIQTYAEALQIVRMDR